jgi:hypothetical protein
MRGRAQLQNNQMRHGSQGKSDEVEPNCSSEMTSYNRTVENATRSPQRVAPPRAPSDQSSDGSFWTPPPATFDEGYSWSSLMIQSPTSRDTKGSSHNSPNLVCNAPRLPSLPNDTDKDSHRMRARTFHLPPRFSNNVPSVLRPLSPAPLHFPTGSRVRPHPRTATLETLPHELAPTSPPPLWSTEELTGRIRSRCPRRTSGYPKKGHGTSN